MVQTSHLCPGGGFSDIIAASAPKPTVAYHSLWKPVPEDMIAFWTDLGKRGLC